MFRQTRRRRPRFASRRALPAVALAPADHLRRALPAPADPRFDDIVEVLDSAFAGPSPGEAGRPDVKPGAPRRVLPLAFLSVLAVLLFARATIEITWELAGERYAGEIVGEKLQNARTTPALT
jgi:hypothetical protein